MLRRPAVIALLITLLVALGAPPAAFAGFAQMSDDQRVAQYDGEGDGDDVRIALTAGGMRVQFQDVAASGMGAEIPCTVDAPDTASCPVAQVLVSLGGGDDTVNVLSPLSVSIGGGGGLDTMTGGPLGDQLRGGDGPDRITGSGGDDTIIGDNPAAESQVAGGADVIDGGVGNDDVNGGVAPDQIAGGAGNDAVSGGEGNDLLIGGDGNDVMEATQGDRGGDDSLDGGSGDDTLQGGTGVNGRDAFIGGSGRDGATFAERANPLTLSLDGQPNDGEPGEGDDLRADVEDVTGGAGGDRIAGSAAANVLAGGPGDDDLAGAGGDDRLVAGQGDDVLQGDASPSGRDTLVGGLGRDLAAYGARTRALSLTLDGQANDGETDERDLIGADVEDAAGGGGNDDLVGNAGANALTGGAGENYVDGAGGGDSFVAGGSGDVFRSRDGVADALTCAGNDFVVADRADTVTGCGRVDLDVAHAPVLAVSAVVRPTGGSVEMGPVGISRLVPLKDTINLPMGSNLDSRNGKVKVTSSKGSGGAARQSAVATAASAEFSEGLFQIRQLRARRARTDIIMRGGDFGACGGSSSGARAVAAARSKRTIRRLRGSGRGRFRTRGRYSAATVRGTRWTVRDRCDGTLTSVRSGRVSVFDFGRRKTIFVRSGRSYLARATRAALRGGR